MKTILIRAAGIVALCASVAGAKLTVDPSTQPSTQPTHIPTPAELFKKMKAMDAQVDAGPKVAYFDLSRPVTEKPAEFSLFGGEPGTTLHSLIERLHKARDDKNVKAVLMTFG